MSEPARTERRKAHTLRYGDMILSVETITPAIAERLLKKNLTNRRLRPRFVKMYAKDMERKAWARKPVAICIDKDGNVVNGQHSLEAVIASGIAQEFLVSRNTPEEAVIAMDVGVRRTIADLAHFAGIDLQTREAAIARVMLYGIEDTEPHSFEDIFDGFIVHEEAIRAVSIPATAGHTGFNSTVLAVCAIAWYTCDRIRLAQFLEILKSGIASSDPADRSVIMFRDWIRSRAGGGANGRAARIETYHKTQSILAAYLEGRYISKIYAAASPKFVLKK